MKNHYKIAFLFTVAASFVGLSADEGQVDSNKEISMSQSGETCPKPDHCKGSRLEFDYYKHDPNDADYDVYTHGGDSSNDGDSQENCKSCSKKGSSRKGAAKAAQE